MKKLFAITILALFVLSFIPSGFAQEDTCRTADDLAKHRLDVRKHFAELRTERHRLGMDVVISYASEQGLDASGLTTIRDNFVSKATDIKNSQTNEEFETIAVELKNLAKDFRETAVGLISDTSAVRTKVQTEISNKESDLNKLRTGALDSEKDLRLKRFDAHLCRADIFLSKLEAREIDTASAREKYNAISEKREQASEAFDKAVVACDYVLKGCEAVEKKEYDAIVDSIKSEFRDLKTKTGEIITDKKRELKETAVKKVEERKVAIRKALDEKDKVAEEPNGTE